MILHNPLARGGCRQIESFSGKRSSKKNKINNLIATLSGGNGFGCYREGSGACKLARVYAQQDVPVCARETNIGIRHCCLPTLARKGSRAIIDGRDAVIFNSYVAQYDRFDYADMYHMYNYINNGFIVKIAQPRTLDCLSCKIRVVN